MTRVELREEELDFLIKLIANLVIDKMGVQTLQSIDKGNERSKDDKEKH